MQKLSTVRIVNIVVFIQFRILPILISQTPFRFLNQFYRIGKVAIHLIDFLLLAFNIIYRSSVFYLVPDIVNVKFVIKNPNEMIGFVSTSC
ncbi:MAG: hypothetical protein CMC35_09670 [Flavobacteriaceae bacterium]|nr:hypothetical protein [Flavobacteriaceae bacterium]